MNPDTTPTPRTDAAHNACTHDYGNVLECSRKLERELAEKTNEIDRLKNELRGEIGWRQAKESEVEKLHNEVARLKEMVMDAARRGDEMSAHWKERAEKAEAIIKQLHHYAGIIEGFQNETK